MASSAPAIEVLEEIQDCRAENRVASTRSPAGVPTTERLSLITITIIEF